VLDVAGRRTVCGGEAVAQVSPDGITYVLACRRHATKARNDGWWTSRARPRQGGHL
jgi:hypothetical protein